jgi:hypothetical protein
MALSDADFASIVEEAYQHAKLKHSKSAGKLRTTSSVTSTVRRTTTILLTYLRTVENLSEWFFLATIMPYC